MPAELLLHAIQDILADAKGREVRILDVRQITDITDYMIIVNGTSTRHVSAMTDKVIEGMRERGQRPLGVEGQDLGEWVLVDFGDVIVHLMRPQTRAFYNLEKLWGNGNATDGALKA
ncbi:MAG: ribosome silencing factor [Acidiferrobacterales bacterium]|nr:ribosome silencing factor [Acidiferrobacterales bacterium]